MPRPFYAILTNTVVASVTNTCVWFAVTFWVYLETQSVIATSIMAGLYLVAVAVSGIYLGSLVDRYRKKSVMMVSSAVSLGCFALAGLIYIITPLIGGWYGTGTDRGLALLFSAAGTIGLIVTLLAVRSSAYRSVAAIYDGPQVEEARLLEA